MPDLKLQCRCGDVQGRVRDFSPSRSTRTICTCADCQTYANQFPEPERILDEYGGTDIVQMTPAQVTIDQGMEQMRCLRLTPKGLYRWYADCCQTPIANTISPGFPFVGLPHTALAASGSLDDCLGPVNFYIQGKTAKAERPGVKVHPGFPIAWFLYSTRWILPGLVRGKSRPSPFFDAQGRPVKEPRIVAD